MAGTKGVPRFSQALLAEHTEGLVALSGCRDGELIRRLRVGDRAGARAVAERYATLFGRGDGPGQRAASSSSCRITSLPDDDWLVAEAAALAEELGLPVVVTNDVHYARPEDRELADVLAAIRHGRTLETLADLRRADGESYLKSGEELAALARRRERAWTEGIADARWSWRPRARSISGSSSTASRASRCRTGRRRSPTSRSCARRAPAAAITR